jgi:CrcB protein
VSAALVLGVAVAGAGGAVARFTVDGSLTARRSGVFPWATLLINVVGSVLLGVLTGLVIFQHVADGWRVVLGTGFCGGFTTFSTASFASVRLAQDNRPALAAFNVLGTLVLCTGAAGLGLLVASA